MTIHLIRTPEYPLAEFRDVFDLLQSLKLAGWCFIAQPAEPEIAPEGEIAGSPRHTRRAPHAPSPTPSLSWVELFGRCKVYRAAAGVPPADLVVVLTSRPNDDNWFSAGDEEGNMFVHAAEWEHYIAAPSMYPIVYEVLSNVLQLQLVARAASLAEFIHVDSIGCMNDFCGHKADVQLKLRTGDICEACYLRLLAAGVPAAVVDDVLDAFEQLRKQMLFRAGFRRGPWPSPILVNGHGRITLPEYGNLELKLSPIQRALYLFFLQHPEGMPLSALADHREELLALYTKLSPRDDQGALSLVIDRLVDLRDNSINEKISGIRRALTNRDALGKERSPPYLIAGQRSGAYRIALPRELVELSSFVN